MNTLLTPNTTIKAQSLAQTFESLSSSYPTPLTLYQTGEILYEYHNSTTIQTLFERILECIPIKELNFIFGTIENSFIKLVSQNGNEDDLLQALKNICGLYSCSKFVCNIRMNKQRSKNDTNFMDVLSNILEELDRTDEKYDIISEILCCMIQYGLITNTKLQQDDEESQLHRIIQTISEMDYLSILLQYQHQYPHSYSFHNAVMMEFPEDTVEKRYLLQLFQYHPSEVSNNGTNATSSTNDQTKSSPNNIPKNDNNPIQQISEMFQDYGLGYLETAYACYGCNTEQTISALLQSQDNPNGIHPRLRYLDKNLPSLQKLKTDQVYTTPDADVVKEQKEAWRQQRQQYEQDTILFEKALRVDDFSSNDYGSSTITNHIAPTNQDLLYNDDYDDQYDYLDEKVYGIDNNNTSSSTFENNNEKYDAIKVYNRLLREDEEDEAFWAQNQNLNRVVKEKETEDVNDAKQQPNKNRTKTSQSKKPQNKKPPKQNEETTDLKDQKQQHSKNYSKKKGTEQHRFRKKQALKRTEPTS